MGTATKPATQFHIGQAVCHPSFLDCFGKHTDATTGLHIIEMELIEPDYMAPYYRLTAIGENGKHWIRAAERFFQPEEPCAR